MIDVPVVRVPILDCLRCGYVWRPRRVAVRRCPRCKSLKWNLSRVARRRRGGKARLGALVEAHRLELRRIARRYHAARLRVFGSFARGEEGADSDVDIIFEPGPRALPFDRFHLQEALSDLLGRKVDLVTEAGLHPMIRAQVLVEAVTI